MSEFWEKFAMELLLNAIPILVPVVIAIFVNLCLTIWQKIKDRQPNIAWNLEQAAEFAVNAAEQVGLSGALVAFADSKLDYAIEVAQKYLETQGIKHIDLGLLRAAIEAAVKKADFQHAEQ